MFHETYLGLHCTPANRLSPLAHHLSSMTNAFIVGSKRTAFGSFGGKLSNITAAQLGGYAAKAALAQLPANTPVSSTVFGVVAHTDHTAPYTSRHVGH